MRIESSVTSVSWIPSAAITGVTQVPFGLGVAHYDDPPPDEWKDLDSVLGPEGARFANNLAAWVEVEDGKITGFGQSGEGRVSSTLVRLRGMRVQVEAVGYPDLRPAPVAGDTILAEGETADDIILVLDGVVEVEAAGSVLATLGPGAVLGERASLEHGRRTATVRALTNCRIVTYLAADLSPKDLRELATGHHREDQQQ
jgi:hypothetical protein